MKINMKKFPTLTKILASEDSEYLKLLNGSEVNSLKYEGTVGVEGKNVLQNGEVIDTLDTPEKIKALWDEYYEQEMGGESLGAADDKKFLEYFMSFYGPDGIYPMEGLKEQDIQEGVKARGDKFEGDSADRELIRDMILDGGKAKMVKKPKAKASKEKVKVVVFKDGKKAQEKEFDDYASAAAFGEKYMNAPYNCEIHFADGTMEDL